MNRFSLLREALQAFLLSVHSTVSYERADPKAAFPRLVFDLPNSFEDGPVEVFVLDVDGWDDNSDTTALDALMGAVDGNGDPSDPTGLHRRALALGGLRATVYRDRRLSLTDDDPRIRRRKYTYQVRVYEG